MITCSKPSDTVRAALQGKIRSKMTFSYSQKNRHFPTMIHNCFIGLPKYPGWAMLFTYDEERREVSYARILPIDEAHAIAFP